jgi:sugar-specific transcriptional regulator TrmB
MLVKQELINRIRDYFNLNIYETKVWLALLGRGVASAGEIAEISRVPRSRTYDVLETLEKKGFAIVRIGKPVKYIGVKPKVILERLRNNVIKEAQEKTDFLLKIKDTEEFAQLEEMYKGGADPVRGKELSVALKGKASIYSHLKEIIQNANKEVVICTNAQEISSRAKLYESILAFLSKSKIDLKIALFGDNELIKQIEHQLKTSIKRTNINARFFIIDRKEVLFYLSKEGHEDTALWINSDFFSAAFASLFDKALNEGK